MAALADKTGTLTIETVATTDPAKFKRLPQGSFAGGFVAHLQMRWREDRSDVA